jgi:hypothetical protein
MGLTELQRLRNTVDLFLRAQGLEHHCNVQLSRSGKWYVLSGVVDSPWTKAALFSLVPVTRTGRHVINKLQVADNNRWMECS